MKAEKTNHYFRNKQHTARKEFAMKKVIHWIAAHKVLVFLPGLLLVLLLVWLLRPRSAAAGYREETVTARDIQTYNSFVGKVEVASDRTVLSSVSETVTEVPVRLGDRVEQGQTIALLDTEALQYNISLKEASLSAAQTTNRYNIQDAQRTYENYKAAVDSGLNTSLQSAQNQVDSTYTALQNAQSSYDSTRASQLELTNLRNSLADYTITAPCSGTVTALNVQPGDAVTPQTVLAVISDLDSMEIAIRVDEYSILNTAVGSPVTVYVDSIDSSYNGVLSWVADTATVENGVSYFEATVRFVPDEKVRSGMSVETHLVNVDAPGTLSVSVEAVQYREDNTAYVLVRGDDGEPGWALSSA